MPNKTVFIVCDSDGMLRAFLSATEAAAFIQQRCAQTGFYSSYTTRVLPLGEDSAPDA